MRKQFMSGTLDGNTFFFRSDSLSQTHYLSENTFDTLVDKGVEFIVIIRGNSSIMTSVDDWINYGVRLNNTISIAEWRIAYG